MILVTVLRADKTPVGHLGTNKTLPDYDYSLALKSDAISLNDSKHLRVQMSLLITRLAKIFLFPALLAMDDGVQPVQTMDHQTKALESLKKGTCVQCIGQLQNILVTAMEYLLTCVADAWKMYRTRETAGRAREVDTRGGDPRVPRCFSRPIYSPCACHGG